ncbi:PqqD family peptide modification chaperone [uncultured Desulfuromonas sp.]|uniref:PqqD family peptide modification chaperone n=1 Tax=uncultured Desulfuromonas sp. TaxID=181013 RepID=UPI00262746B2|nr:PqqD family peptide modification chaperone [uncultured Desulfuromonas sp.]
MNISQNIRLNSEGSLPSASPYVHFFPFADGGVLFLQGTNRVWTLNLSSAYIWCLLDGETSVEDMTATLAAKFSIDEVTSRRDVEDALNRFEREGLLGADRPQDSGDGIDPWKIDLTGPPLAEQGEWAVRRSFATPHQVFEFSCSDFRLGEAFAETMTHLSSCRGALPDTRLAVLPSDSLASAWDIYLDGRRYKAGVPENGVLPCLASVVFIRASEALNQRFLIHAAVLGNGNRVILFPADAGSGKTTLAAALAANGLKFFSDELAVLNVDTLRVSPLPLPMSIKPGSVEILARYYPGLAQRSVWLRLDGTHVRYLPPPLESLPLYGDLAPVGSIVFLRYEKGAQTRLLELGKFEALQRLVKTGSSNRECRAKDIEALLKMVEGILCHELVCSDLDTAISLLEEEIL